MGLEASSPSKCLTTRVTLITDLHAAGFCIHPQPRDSTQPAYHTLHDVPAANCSIYPQALDRTQPAYYSPHDAPAHGIPAQAHRTDRGCVQPRRDDASAMRKALSAHPSPPSHQDAAAMPTHHESAMRLDRQVANALSCLKQWGQLWCAACACPTACLFGYWITPLAAPARQRIL